MVKGKSHPYIPSGGMLIQTFDQFRRAFPKTINAETLKKLSLAPNNESRIIALFKFFEFIDDNGNKTDAGKKLFIIHDDKKFQDQLKKIVKEKYDELFELRGEDAWTLDRDSLIGFFRTADETSALTAQRQSIAFGTLASLCGYGDIPSQRKRGRQPQKTTEKSGKNTSKPAKKSLNKPRPDKSISIEAQNDIGLTVRIEINLPAQGDQATYDRIFQSIRKNLLNG